MGEKPNCCDFLATGRCIPTTCVHISWTAMGGKGVYYMYLETCKAQLPFCFWKLVIDSTWCQNSCHFVTFGPRCVNFDGFLSEIDLSDLTSVFPVKNDSYPCDHREPCSDLSVSFMRCRRLPTSDTMLKKSEFHKIASYRLRKTVANLLSTMDSDATLPRRSILAVLSIVCIRLRRGAAPKHAVWVSAHETKYQAVQASMILKLA